MTSPVATHKRLEWLDSLRGFAALIVLFNHSQKTLEGPPIVKWVLRLPGISMIRDDRTAVTMFFVLSGFVLALPYARARADGVFRQLRIGIFYLRRITRIWLPWLAVFLASCVVKFFFSRNLSLVPPMSGEARGLASGPLNLTDFVQQLYFGLHDPSRQLLPQDWSLGVEMKGSALIPLFLLLLRWNSMALAAVGVAFLFVPTTGIYYFTFALGVLLARYSGDVAGWFEALPRLRKTAVFSFGLFLFNARYWLGFATHRDGILWTVAAFGCALILICAMGSAGIQAALSRPVFAAIGRISYSIYLVQFIILLAVGPLLIHGLNQAGVIEPNVCYGLFILFAFSLTILLAALTYRWIEVPCMDLGHWLSKRFERKEREGTTEFIPSAVVEK